MKDTRAIGERVVDLIVDSIVCGVFALCVVRFAGFSIETGWILFFIGTARAEILDKIEYSQ